MVYHVPAGTAGFSLVHRSTTRNVCTENMFREHVPAGTVPRTSVNARHIIFKMWEVSFDAQCPIFYPLDKGKGNSLLHLSDSFIGTYIYSRSKVSRVALKWVMGYIFIHISANMRPFGLKFSQIILHTETSKQMYNWSFLFVVLHKPTLLPSTFKATRAWCETTPVCSGLTRLVRAEYSRHYSGANGERARITRRAQDGSVQLLSRPVSFKMWEVSFDAQCPIFYPLDKGKGNSLLYLSDSFIGTYIYSRSKVSRVALKWVMGDMEPGRKYDCIFGGYF